MNKYLISLKSIVISYILAIAVIGATFLLVGLPTVFAATDTQYDPCTVFGNCADGTVELANKDSDDLVVDLVLGFSYFLIYIGIAIAVLFIILGGYKLVTANGNDTEYKNGRAMVTNAIIGLVLIIVSVTVVQVVSTIVSGAPLMVFFGS